MNRIIVFLFATVMLASCGQGGSKSDKKSAESEAITVAEFIADASPMVEKSVSISGTVVHVCRHGGQRMFIIGEEGDDRIRITTGENIAEFDVALEGEKVAVVGIVKELVIDETYLAEWEAEVLEGDMHDRGEGHEGGVGHGDDHGDAGMDHDEDKDHDAEHAEDPEHDEKSDQEATLSKIQKLREEIAASGKDHLSDYWIETLEFKVIKE